MKKLTKDIAWSFLSFIFRLLSNVVIFIIIARSYGPDKFGQFSFYTLIGSFLLLMSDFGVHQRYFSLLSINETYDREIRKLLTIKLTFVSLSFLLLSLFAIYNRSVALLCVGLSFIINSLYDFFLIRLRANGEFKKETLYAFINNVCFFVTSAICLLYTHNIILLSFTMLSSRVIALFIVLKISKDVRALSVCKIKLKDISDHLYYGLDFILINIWSFLDGAIVRLVFSNLLFGVYSSFTRLTNGVSSLSVIVTNVLFSKIANDALKKEHNNLVFSCGVFFLSGLSLLLLVALYGSEIILLVLGHEYEKYSLLLMLLTIPIVLKWLSSGFGIYLFSLGLIKFRVWIQLVSIILFFSTTFVLYYFVQDVIIIPIAISISYLSIFISYLFLVLRKINDN
ncbi:lipopolysaccharide biosynthesis protein [Vibrio vulnificus]|uniref:Polysaccharide biosynthesis protein n=1 Tax=Vibrio vulnificus TaxID=672 RepID=A0AAW4H894_VIBVL|nr:hypothetical protein [Vibrio vulnificus]EIA1297727.1 hypothetical protein [Vibrio vulnificus]EIZ4623485.1 hypothetical protein [Vibrio vulnificus]EJB0300321.1 hypothetical protein [Vibrio vulnificus]MBN8121708.1 hypothetical protein [Vibrio vulnificus]PAO31884.1 hypothetical protein BST49_13460 [Vibrio vulnificus]